MRKSILVSITFSGALGFGSASFADPYTFAIVPKNTNNPYFDQALAGCKKAEKELKDAVKCLYIGPAERGDANSEARIVAALIAKGVDGIAVAPADAPAIAKALQGAADRKIPVLTWQSDLLPQDQGLRAAYLGARDYDVGVQIAKLVQQAKPKGGTICIQSDSPTSANYNERIQGIRDTLAAKTSQASPGERLSGQNGWREAEGCPVYTNGDSSRSTQEMRSVLSGNPSLDSFASTDGLPEFQPDAYEQIAAENKQKIASGALTLVFAGALPVQIRLMKEGISAGQVGQRPFDIGYKAMYLLKDLKDGKPLQKEPTFTGLEICTPNSAAACAPS